MIIPYRKDNMHVKKDWKMFIIYGLKDNNTL